MSADRILDRISSVEPRSLLVISDFDGTLAPIVPFPAHARAVPGVLRSLERLARCVGEVVILTGRSRLSLLLALEDQVLEGVRILCNYGADDPERPIPIDAEVIAGLLDAISHLHGQLPEGVMIEEKGTSIALHTRGCREPIAALSQIGIVLGPIAHELGLDMQQGRDVIDIGLRFGGKAATVERLLQERLWSAVVMFGDDHSDLDAFDVLGRASLPTVTVGVASAEVPGVHARSDVVVSSPHEVGGMLARLVESFTPAESNRPRSR